MWPDWSCAVNRNRKVGTNSLEPLGANTVQTKVPTPPSPSQTGGLGHISFLLEGDYTPWLWEKPLQMLHVTWANCVLPLKKCLNEAKRGLSSAQTLHLCHHLQARWVLWHRAVCQTGRRLRGLWRGWVPSLNKAWEMPARPRAKWAERNMDLLNEGKKNKEIIKMHEQTDIVRMHPALVPVTHLHVWIDGEN